jgi:hypothetical protein
MFCRDIYPVKYMKKNKKILIISSAVFLIMLFSTAFFFFWFHGIGNSKSSSVETALFGVSDFQNGAALSASCDANGGMCDWNISWPFGPSACIGDQGQTCGGMGHQTIYCGTNTYPWVSNYFTAEAYDNMYCKNPRPGMEATYGLVHSETSNDGSHEISQSCAMPACSTYLLTVAKNKKGTGTGTVTSLDALINCGLTCSHSYTSGASVGLKAVANSGSSFTGWNVGGCDNMLPDGTCALTMNAARTVTATFTLNPCTPRTSCPPSETSWLGDCTANCGGGTGSESGVCSDGCNGSISAASRSCTNSIPCPSDKNWKEVAP